MLENLGDEDVKLVEQLVIRLSKGALAEGSAAVEVTG
jgi:hypothetical protein